MSQKAILKVEVKKLETENSKNRLKLADFTKQLSLVDSKFNKELADAHASAETRFNEMQAAKIDQVKQCIADKRVEVEKLVDSFPGLEKQEIAGKLELQQICLKLEQAYPPGLIDNYSCEQLTEYEDDGEAFEDYQRLEKLSSSLGGHTNQESLFDKLSDIFIAVAESADGDDDGVTGNKRDIIIGSSIAGALVLFTVFVPFIVLFGLAVIAGVGLIQGIKTRQVLQKLYSIRKYLNQAYDRDVFQEDKTSIMEEVDTFLRGVESDYIEEVKQKEFVFDEHLRDDIERRRVDEFESIKSKIQALTNLINSKERDINKMNDEISKFEEEERQRAAKLREEYFSKICLDFAWLDNILIDITTDNRIKTTPNYKGNTLYYSTSGDSIQKFAKLYIFQVLLRSHTDYLSSVILDYKYMGGELLQFQGLPPNSCRLCFNQEDIDQRVDVMNNDMRARASNILSTCTNLEEFNKLMSEYGSTGENFWIVHVFGLPTVTEEFKFFLKNGSKVGYFFKLYLTTSEIKDVYDSLDFDDFMAICEVGDLVYERSPNNLEEFRGK